MSVVKPTTNVLLLTTQPPAKPPTRFMIPAPLAKHVTQRHARRPFFRQQFTLEDDIAFHAFFAPLAASMHATDGVLLGCPLPLTIINLNSVKACV
jgi:hypothetical protein